MNRQACLLGPLMLALLGGCGNEPDIQRQSNGATNDAVNEISQNISENDGAEAVAAPLDAAGVGRSMRSAASQPPR